MALLSRVAVIVAMLAVPLALALASQVLAERPGRPEVDPQQVRLDVDVQDQAPTESPAAPGETPRLPTEPTDPSLDPAPSPTPTGPEGPRVVSPSVPGGDDDRDDETDDEVDDESDDEGEGEDD